MNHNLRIIRRYDATIDRAMLELEANAPRTIPAPPTFEQSARESDEAAQRTVEALTAMAAYAGLIVACVVAVVG